MKFLNVIALMLTQSLLSNSLIIPGNRDSGENYGLIFIGSEYIQIENYYSNLLDLHKRLDSKVWIVVSNVSKNKKINEIIENDLSLLIESGMSFNETTPFYFIGHSDGKIYLN